MQKPDVMIKRETSMTLRGAKKFAKIFAVSVTLIFSLFAAVAVYSQVTGATLAGTVTDASGAVVAGAQITVRKNATGVTRDVTSDSSGFYTLPNIIPADYEVRVSAKGFSTAVQTGLSLAVGQQKQLSFSLKVVSENGPDPPL